MFDKLEKKYVSEYDKLLETVDNQKTLKTASVQREIDKAAHIALLRDDPNAVELNDTLWKEF